ncbi:PTPRR phosphatase, partial [Polypterus senegalus]|nr:PTPRR phosphatase [Polypterus senegalus]
MFSFTAGCFSGDDDPFGTVHQHEPKKPFIFYQDTEDSDGGLGLDDIDKLKNIFHSASTARINKLRPELFLKTSFRKAANVPTVNLLARTDEDLVVENVPLPSRDVIVVTSVINGADGDAQQKNIGNQKCLVQLVTECFVKQLSVKGDIR